MHIKHSKKVQQSSYAEKAVIIAGRERMPLFHLRRVGPASSRRECADLIDFRKNVTTIGRNPGVADYIINSASYIQNGCISRRHARVVRQKDRCYKLYDDSRNGVFINDIKIDGHVILVEGDTVTFGHRNGENLRPGTRARQPDSEYQFIFEQCTCQPPRDISIQDGRQVAMGAPQTGKFSKAQQLGSRPDTKGPGGAKPVVTSTKKVLTSTSWSPGQNIRLCPSTEENRPCISTGQDIKPCTSTGHNITPFTSTGHNIKPSTYTGHNIKPSTSTGHNIKPSTYTGHNITPCTPTCQNLRSCTSVGHRVKLFTPTCQNMEPCTSTWQNIRPCTSTGQGIKLCASTCQHIGPCTATGLNRPCTATGLNRPCTATGLNIRQCTATGLNIRPCSSGDQQRLALQQMRKCEAFLCKLLVLEQNEAIPNLVQGLIDGKMEPADFTNSLQVAVRSSPLTSLVPFLKEALPLLRIAMSRNEAQICGIVPPLCQVSPTLGQVLPFELGQNAVGQDQGTCRDVNHTETQTCDTVTTMQTNLQDHMQSSLCSSCTSKHVIEHMDGHKEGEEVAAEGIQPKHTLGLPTSEPPPKTSCKGLKPDGIQENSFSVNRTVTTSRTIADDHKSRPSPGNQIVAPVIPMEGINNLDRSTSPSCTAEGEQSAGDVLCSNLNMAGPFPGVKEKPKGLAALMSSADILSNCFTASLPDDINSSMLASASMHEPKSAHSHSIGSFNMPDSSPAGTQKGTGKTTITVITSSENSEPGLQAMVCPEEGLTNTTAQTIPAEMRSRMTAVQQLVFEELEDNAMEVDEAYDPGERTLELETTFSSKDLMEGTARPCSDSSSIEDFTAENDLNIPCGQEPEFLRSLLEAKPSSAVITTNPTMKEGVTESQDLVQMLQVNESSNSCSCTLDFGSVEGKNKQSSQGTGEARDTRESSPQKSYSFMQSLGLRGCKVASVPVEDSSEVCPTKALICEKGTAIRRSQEKPFSQAYFENSATVYGENGFERETSGQSSIKVDRLDQSCIEGKGTSQKMMPCEIHKSTEDLLDKQVVPKKDAGQEEKDENTKSPQKISLVSVNRKGPTAPGKSDTTIQDSGLLKNVTRPDGTKELSLADPVIITGRKLPEGTNPDPNDSGRLISVGEQHTSQDAMINTGELFEGNQKEGVDLEGRQESQSTRVKEPDNLKHASLRVETAEGVPRACPKDDFTVIRKLAGSSEACSEVLKLPHTADRPQHDNLLGLPNVKPSFVTKEPKDNSSVHPPMLSQTGDLNWETFQETVTENENASKHEASEAKDRNAELKLKSITWTAPLESMGPEETTEQTHYACEEPNVSDQMTLREGEESFDGLEKPAQNQSTTCEGQVPSRGILHDPEPEDIGPYDPGEATLVLEITVNQTEGLSEAKSVGSTAKEGGTTTTGATQDPLHLDPEYERSNGPVCHGTMPYDEHSQETCGSDSSVREPVKNASLDLKVPTTLKEGPSSCRPSTVLPVIVEAAHLRNVITSNASEKVVITLELLRKEDIGKQITKHSQAFSTTDVLKIKDNNVKAEESSECCLKHDSSLPTCSSTHCRAIVGDESSVDGLLTNSSQGLPQCGLYKEEPSPAEEVDDEKSDVHPPVVDGKFEVPSKEPMVVEMSKLDVTSPKEIIRGEDKKLDVTSPQEPIVEEEGKFDVTSPQEPIVEEEGKFDVLLPQEPIVEEEGKFDVLLPQEPIVEEEGKFDVPLPQEPIVEEEGKFDVPLPQELIVVEEGKFDVPLPQELIVVEEGKFDVPLPQEPIVVEEGKFDVTSPQELIVVEEGKLDVTSPQEPIAEEEGKFDVPLPQELIVEEEGKLDVPLPQEPIAEEEGKFDVPLPQELIVEEEGKLDVPLPQELIAEEEGKFDVTSPQEPITEEESKFDVTSPQELIVVEEGKFDVTLPQEPIVEEEGKFDVPLPQEPIAEEEGKFDVTSPQEPIAEEEGKFDVPLPQELIVVEEGKFDVPLPQELIVVEEGKLDVPLPQEPIVEEEGKFDVPLPQEPIVVEEGKFDVPLPQEPIVEEEGKFDVPSPQELIVVEEGKFDVPLPQELIVVEEGKFDVPLPQELIVVEEGKFDVPLPQEPIVVEEGKFDVTLPQEPIVEEEGKLDVPSPQELIVEEEGKLDVTLPQEPIAEEEGKFDVTSPQEPIVEEEGKLDVTLPQEPIVEEEGKFDVPLPQEPIVVEEGKFDVPLPQEPITEEESKLDVTSPQELIVVEEGKFDVPLPQEPIVEEEGKFDVPLPQEPIVEEEGKFDVPLPQEPIVEEEGKFDVPLPQEPIVVEEGKFDVPLPQEPIVEEEGKFDVPLPQEPIVVEEGKFDVPLPQEPIVEEEGKLDVPLPQEPIVEEEGKLDVPLPQEPIVEEEGKFDVTSPQETIVEEEGKFDVPLPQEPIVVEEGKFDVPLPQEPIVEEEGKFDVPLPQEPIVEEEGKFDVPLPQEPIVVEEGKFDVPLPQEPIVVEEGKFDVTLPQEPIVEEEGKLDVPSPQELIVEEEGKLDVTLPQEPIAEEEGKFDVTSPQEPIVEEEGKLDVTLPQEPIVEEEGKFDVPLPQEPIVEEEGKFDVTSPQEPIVEEEGKFDVTSPQEPIVVEEGKFDVPLPQEPITEEESKLDVTSPQELIVVEEGKFDVPLPQEPIVEEEGKFDVPLPQEPIVEEEGKFDVPLPQEPIVEEEGKFDVPLPQEPIVVEEGKFDVPLPQEPIVEEEGKFDVPLPQEPIVVEEGKFDVPLPQEPIVEEEGKLDVPLPQEPIVEEEGKLDVPLPQEPIVEEEGKFDVTSPQETIVEEEGKFDVPLPQEPIVVEEGKFDVPLPQEPIVEEEGKFDVPLPQEPIVEEEGKFDVPLPQEPIVVEEGKFDVPLPQEPIVEEEGKFDVPLPQELIVEEEGKFDVTSPQEPIVEEEGKLDVPLPQELIVEEEGKFDVTSPQETIVEEEGKFDVPLPQEPIVVEEGKFDVPLPQEPIVVEEGKFDVPLPQEPIVEEEGKFDVPLPQETIVVEEGKFDVPLPQEPIVEEEGKLDVTSPQEPISEEEGKFDVTSPQEPIVEEEGKLDVTSPQEPITEEESKLDVTSPEEPITSNASGEPITSSGWEQKEYSTMLNSSVFETRSGAGSVKRTFDDSYPDNEPDHIASCIDANQSSSEPEYKKRRLEEDSDSDMSSDSVVYDSEMCLGFRLTTEEPSMQKSCDSGEEGQDKYKVEGRFTGDLGSLRYDFETKNQVPMINEVGYSSEDEGCLDVDKTKNNVGSPDCRRERTCLPDTNLPRLPDTAIEKTQNLADEEETDKVSMPKLKIIDNPGDEHDSDAETIPYSDNEEVPASVEEAPSNDGEVEIGTEKWTLNTSSGSEQGADKVNECGMKTKADFLDADMGSYTSLSAPQPGHISTETKHRVDVDWKEDGEKEDSSDDNNMYDSKLSKGSPDISLQLKRDYQTKQEDTAKAAEDAGSVKSTKDADHMLKDKTKLMSDTESEDETQDMTEQEVERKDISKVYVGNVDTCPDEGKGTGQQDDDEATQPMSDLESDDETQAPSDNETCVKRPCGLTFVQGSAMEEGSNKNPAERSQAWHAVRGYPDQLTSSSSRPADLDDETQPMSDIESEEETQLISASRPADLDDETQPVLHIESEEETQLITDEEVGSHSRQDKKYGSATSDGNGINSGHDDQEFCSSMGPLGKTDFVALSNTETSAGTRELESNIETQPLSAVQSDDETQELEEEERPGQEIASQLTKMHAGRSETKVITVEVKGDPTCRNNYVTHVKFDPSISGNSKVQTVETKQESSETSENEEEGPTQDVTDVAQAVLVGRATSNHMTGSPLPDVEQEKPSLEVAHGDPDKFENSAKSKMEKAGPDVCRAGQGPGVGIHTQISDVTTAEISDVTIARSVESHNQDSGDDDEVEVCEDDDKDAKLADLADLETQLVTFEDEEGVHGTDRETDTEEETYVEDYECNTSKVGEEEQAYAEVETQPMLSQTDDDDDDINVDKMERKIRKSVTHEPGGLDDSEKKAESDIEPQAILSETQEDHKNHNTGHGMISKEEGVPEVQENVSAIEPEAQVRMPTVGETAELLLKDKADSVTQTMADAEVVHSVEETMVAVIDIPVKHDTFSSQTEDEGLPSSEENLKVNNEVTDGMDCEASKESKDQAQNPAGVRGDSEIKPKESLDDIHKQLDSPAGSRTDSDTDKSLQDKPSLKQNPPLLEQGQTGVSFVANPLDAVASHSSKIMYVEQTGKKEHGEKNSAPDQFTNQSVKAEEVTQSYELRSKERNAVNSPRSWSPLAPAAVSHTSGEEEGQFSDVDSDEDDSLSCLMSKGHQISPIPGRSPRYQSPRTISRHGRMSSSPYNYSPRTPYRPQAFRQECSSPGSNSNQMGVRRGQRRPLAMQASIDSRSPTSATSRAYNTPPKRALSICEHQPPFTTCPESSQSNGDSLLKSPAVSLNLPNLSEGIDKESNVSVAHGSGTGPFLLKEAGLAPSMSPAKRLLGKRNLEEDVSFTTSSRKRVHRDPSQVDCVYTLRDTQGVRQASPWGTTETCMPSEINVSAPDARKGAMMEGNPDLS